MIQIKDKNKKLSHRACHSATTYNNKILIFGGQVFKDKNEYNFFNDFHIFNTKSNEWEEIETNGDIPSKRSQHTSFIYKNNLFVVGGHNKNNFFRDVYYLNLTNFTWKKFDLKFENFDISYSGIFPAQITSYIVNDLLFIHGWDNKYDFLINFNDKKIKKIESIYEQKNSSKILNDGVDDSTNLLWMEKDKKWNLIKVQ